MITRITLDNIYSKGGRLEFTVPSKMIVNRLCSFEEWDSFTDKVNVLKKVKEIFENEINLLSDFEYDPTKESTLEIHMKWREEDYTYSMVFCESKLVMESMLENQKWIFSRLKDNPDFALNPTFLNDKGKRQYKKYRDDFPASLLYCFIPGEELLKELRSIIILDEWLEDLGHKGFLRKFKKTFPDLNYNKIINWMIPNFGFGEDYSRLDEDNKNLISKTRPDIKIGLELAGSGFHRLSRLVPLMVASKKHGLMLVSSSPLDYCLHPILGKALMEWYLKDNPNPPIAKLSNIVL